MDIINRTHRTFESLIVRRAVLVNRYRANVQWLLNGRRVRDRVDAQPPPSPRRAAGNAATTQLEKAMRCERPARAACVEGGQSPRVISLLAINFHTLFHFLFLFFSSYTLSLPRKRLHKIRPGNEKR